MPETPGPDIPFPHIEIPGWVRDVQRTKQHWPPIVIGVFVAQAELQRRKRRKVQSDDRA